MKELTLKELSREYQHLKMRIRKSQNLKIWDVLMQYKKGKTNFCSFKTVSNTKIKESNNEEGENKGMNKLIDHCNVNI